MSIKLLRDQKEEYSEHLFEVMFEPVLHIFQDTYEKALQSNPKNVLKEFQQELSKIPEWNQLQVEKAYQNIKCDYFGKLIKTVYILTIKTIMLGIPEDKRDKIKLKVPASDNFLHRCLIHMARELWKRPYLFYHLARSIERQNNIYNCEVILKKKIKAVIRETIPMNWVVEQLGGDNDKEEDSESESSASEESEEEEVSPEESEAEEEEVSPEESESEEEEVEPEESSDSEEEVEESDAEEVDESDSESEVEAEPEKIEDVIAPVENEDEITIVESGYERSDEASTPSVSQEEPESPVEVITADVVPVQEPEPISRPLPLPLPEPKLQNIIIPTDESKRVVYVEEPPKPLLKKKKPKHTFF